jgi:hypothetical protein
VQKFNEWASEINKELPGFFEYLQEECQLPPMFTCLHIGGYCFANILAAYERQGKEPPEELVKFMSETYPALIKSQNDIILDQYLTLNTSGTA